MTKYYSNIFRRFICLSLSIFIIFKGTSQSIKFFDIIPDLDGKYVQGQALIVLPDTNEIFVMGHVLDTTIESIVVQRPFLAIFDYGGNLMRYHLIYDSLLQESYNLYTRPIIRDGNSIIIYIDKSNDQGGYNANMLEIDIDDGSILLSKSYPPPPGLDSNHTGEWYYRDQHKNIIAYHTLGTQRRVFIRAIDSLFNIYASILVDENGRWNGPRHIRSDNDSTFILIGMSILPSNENYPDIKPFFMRVNQSGEIIQFKLVSEIPYKTIGFSALNSYTILRDEKSNWVMSVVIVDDSNCTICPHSIPLSFSMSPEFDTLRWLNYFSGKPIDTQQYYSITSSTLSINHSGFVVSGYDFSLTERNSFLVKIGLNGESLWTRNFIHIEWEQERISWADIEDVKSTPHNTYVLAGVVYDNYSAARVPWVLHLDSMGCLIPGCDKIVSSYGSEPEKGKDFTIFPNPVADHLILFYNGNMLYSQPIHIAISTINGQVIRETKLNPLQGAQYIIPLNSLPPGQYIVKMQNVERSYLQVESIIKL